MILSTKIFRQLIGADANSYGMITIELKKLSTEDSIKKGLFE
jgi:hypothetical protein